MPITMPMPITVTNNRCSENVDAWHTIKKGSCVLLDPIMSDGCISCASQYIDLELVGICDIVFLDERYQNI